MSGFPTRILVAADGSDDATLALRAGTDLSARAGSELHVVHAWRRPTFLGYSPAGRAGGSYPPEGPARSGGTAWGECEGSLSSAGVAGAT